MINQWHLRLLPWMVAILVGSSLIFGLVSLVQYSKIYGWMTEPRVALSQEMWSNDKVVPTNFGEQLSIANARSAYALEGESINQRYASTRTLVALRLWSRYMGFLTGMILAIVGAAFVLGRLSDGGSEVGAEGGGAKLNVKSASPGVMLAVLGSVLITVTLWVPTEIRNDDHPIYFGSGDVSDDAIVAPLSEYYDGTSDSVLDPLANSSGQSKEAE